MAVNENWETSAPTASPFVEQSLGSHNCGVKLQDWGGEGRGDKGRGLRVRVGSGNATGGGGGSASGSRVYGQTAMAGRRSGTGRRHSGLGSFVEREVVKKQAAWRRGARSVRGGPKVWAVVCQPCKLSSGSDFLLML